MSLILDALRKSEAERRRGQAPDLFASPTAPVAPVRHQWSRVWPALVLAALLPGAAFMVWRDRTAAPANGLAIGADPAPASDPQRPARAAPATPAAITPSVSGAPPTAVELAPAASTAVAASPANPPVVRPATRAAAAAATRARKPSSPIPAVANAPWPAPLLPAGPAAEAAVTVSPADQAGGEQDLPPIAALAASERAALPALKLSMHVWNSDPGKRFAIIDGHRVTEGSSVGNAVIGEIRRDGVVLTINGRQVLLPRP